MIVEIFSIMVIELLWMKVIKGGKISFGCSIIHKSMVLRL